MQTQNQLREPRATPTFKYQTTTLRQSVVDKINKLELDFVNQWDKEDIKEIEDYPHNCFR